MLKKAATTFGAIMLVVGILGFIPGIVTEDGELLGLFAVGPIHNLIHIVTGLAALYAGTTGAKASKVFFQIFGVVYALVTILGFMAGDSDLLGIVEHNHADIYLHLVITLLALYLGFVYNDPESATV